MKTSTKQIAVILATIVLMISMSTSLAHAQLANPAGTIQTSYPYVKVGPNPIGDGHNCNHYHVRCPTHINK